MLAGMCGERISPGVCDKVSKRKDIQQVRQQQEGEEIQKRKKKCPFHIHIFLNFSKRDKF